MLKAPKAVAEKPAFQIGDKVIVSERVLPLRAASTESAKLKQRYLGPYTVVEIVNPGAYRLDLPEDCKAVHSVFNECELRPWFDPGDDRELDLTSPPVKPHPALNSIVQVLDRKTFGPVPKNVHVLDIPTQYLCVRRVGPPEWIRGSFLKELQEQALVKKFEWRFPRSEKLPCQSVQRYNPERYADEDAWNSDDELDLGLADDLGQHYGAGSLV